MFAQVKGQFISVFVCENETVVVSPWVVDYEPLMMCLCVWLLGYLWLVWCRRLYDQSLSGCLTDFTALTLFEQDCAWLCLVECYPIICVRRCVYWDALERFFAPKKGGGGERNDKSCLVTGRKTRGWLEATVSRLLQPPHDWWGVNGNITYCWRRGWGGISSSCQISDDLHVRTGP